MMIKIQLNKKGLLLTTITIVGIFCFAIINACQEKTKYYTANDFESVSKTDVHLHINSADPAYMKLAAGCNFRVVSPNVDSRISIDEQLNTAASIKKAWPDRFTFLGTFSVDSFGTAGFAANTIARIDECMKAGASGIKIWKNIGMVLTDKEGRYVMVDDPAFDPIFCYLEENKIPVMGHLGEPKNCWLPFEQMTDSSNLRYYKANPQYHMYLHPEAPSYEDQINARDNLLKKHPKLDFTGSHLASLEWSVDEVAKRLDEFPNLKVDLSARMAHLQYQSIADRERVRDFMVKYQDRILYGTDITINSNEANPDAKTQMLLERWRSNWIYLATDSTLRIKNLPADVKGLQLPQKVIDKIFNTNADRFFSISAPSEKLKIYSVNALSETQPVPRGAKDDAADDPAIWIHPYHQDSSRIIGTDKKGGLAVYDLAGKELYYYADGEMNNVDLRYSFPLINDTIDVVAASNRTNLSVDLYRIAHDGSLKTIHRRPLRSEMTGEVYGLCMFQSKATGKFYVFMNSKEGEVEQWELIPDGDKIDGKIVRKLKLATQVEGMVADDETSTLYVGEEDAGIWKFGAEPGAPANGKLFDKSSESNNENIRFDIEGMAIYRLTDGKGYLIASSQGNNSYAVFQSETPQEYLGSFRIVKGAIDGVNETDGLDVTNIPLGKAFPNGMLVVQDGSNDDNGKLFPQNYKLVRWDSIAVKFSPHLRMR